MTKQTTDTKHGKMCAGYCTCGARFDTFFAERGEMFQTCINGGMWKVGDLPSRKPAAQE